MKNINLLSVVNWLNSGKKSRHIKGHKCTGPRGKYRTAAAAAAQAESESDESDV